MENTRFNASQIYRTNRNFSFCRKALIKVRSARAVFKGGNIDRRILVLLSILQVRLTSLKMS